MPNTKRLQEAEIREGLREGGRIKGFVVVERTDSEVPEYVAYIRTSWTRGYRILRTWRDKEDRTYRILGRLYQQAREFGYMAPVTVYRMGSPELLRFRGVLARDGGPKQATGQDETEAGSSFSKGWPTETD